MLIVARGIERVGETIRYKNNSNTSKRFVINAMTIQPAPYAHLKSSIDHMDSNFNDRCRFLIIKDSRRRQENAIPVERKTQLFATLQGNMVDRTHTHS